MPRMIAEESRESHGTVQQRRGNDGRHEMARLQLQKEDKGNDEILHCVQDDR